MGDVQAGMDMVGFCWFICWVMLHKHEWLCIIILVVCLHVVAAAAGGGCCCCKGQYPLSSSCHLICCFLHVCAVWLYQCNRLLLSVHERVEPVGGPR